jgi:hypothetical protein
MKKWLLALVLLLAPTAAFAQCSGVAPANSLCGNLTGSPNVPGFYSATGAITGTVSQNYIPFGISNNVLGNGVYLLPASGALFASPTGSDTNNTCTNSGTPCTLKGACALRTQIATYLVTLITINLADGTYSATDANGNLCSIAGNSGESSSTLTPIVGNCSTPANVILAVPNSSNGIAAIDAGETSIGCLHVTLGTNAKGFVGGQHTVLDYHSITWDASGTNSVHVLCSQECSMNLNGSGEAITANFSIHWNFGTNATAAIASNTAFPNSNLSMTTFLQASGSVTIDMSSWTTSGAGFGTVTGSRSNLNGPGYLILTGPCNSILPGNSACQIDHSFQTNQADLQTAGNMLNSAMPTATRNGDIIYWNSGAASWWQSVAGCNSSNGCVLTENHLGAPALAAAGQGLGADTGALISNAAVIDIYTEGTVGSITTGKSGFTLWPRAATVENLAFSSNIFTCSVNPTITMYECGTSTICNAPTTIGAVTITAAHTVVSFTSLSSTAIAAGDYTAWDLVGTCTALNPIGKAMVHFN